MYSPIATRWGKRQNLIFTVIAAAVIIVTCARLLTILSFFNRGSFSLDVPTAKSSGPSASLSAIFDAANAKAHKVDGGATISGMDAAPVGFLWGAVYTDPTTQSIELSFSYYRPDGRDITVKVEDADPAAASQIDISTTPGGKSGIDAYNRSRDNLEAYITRLNSYKLTPRDAVVRTWADSREYASKHSDIAGNFLPMIYTEVSETGSPTWHVEYWYKHSTSSFSFKDIFDFGALGVSYVVDGKTGEIKSRKYETITPTPTPEP